MTPEERWVVREGREKGKGRYLTDHFASLEWETDKRHRALFRTLERARTAASAHGGRVVRLVARRPETWKDVARALAESLGHCRLCQTCADWPCCSQCGSEAALERYDAIGKESG